ncbi:protein of unknown function [Herbiconiux ginsengi]|uniref:DUF4436 domain-containing protein n=2 Tax=Herbiconiux ginsengi TaxID=381665 RepID=A0A1H3JRH0_9MICO|nr:protein of unknown function [Herbiconiux ginsengi]
MPEPTRRRRRWVVPVFVAVAVLLYVVVVLLYARSGRDTTIEAEPGDLDAVTVLMQPSAVNGVGELIVMKTAVNAPDHLLEDGGPTVSDDLGVIITPVDGDQTIDIAKGTIPPTSTMSIFSEGTIEDWPLDRYHTQFAVVAFITVDGAKKLLPTHVQIAGGVPGWNLSGFLTVVPEVGVIPLDDGTTEPIPVVDLTASRSGSTLAFGVLLLGLLVVMPTLVLFVAITAFRGKRKVEASFMSWMGAMLFATIPLRTFLPGSPPIGSWIDFLIVLWVIVGLITGLAIYVAAWMRWGTPATRTPESS